MPKLLLLFALTAALWGCSRKSTPVKLPPRATFEVYTIAEAKAPNTIEAMDPVTGGPLFLQTPPILTTADVATVAQSEMETLTVGGKIALDVDLTPAGSAKMAAATATPKGRPIAVVIGGQVVSTPRLISPLSGSFQISGSGVRFISAVKALTRP